MSDQGQAQRDTLAEALRALLAVLDADDDPRWDGENEYSRAHAALAAVAEAAEADRDRLTAERADAIIGENMALQAVEHHKRRANAVAADRDRLAAALRENVGDAYNLLTQGESPTQRRGPSAQRIYDRSRAALAEVAGDDA